jgi:hypothetical protein
VLTLYVPALQAVTRLVVADVQVTEEPSAASVTASHVVHSSAAPLVLTLYVPALQAVTRLVVADVHVTEDPSAASVMAVHWVQKPAVVPTAAVKK